MFYINHHVDEDVVRGDEVSPVSERRSGCGDVRCSRRNRRLVPAHSLGGVLYVSHNARSMATDGQVLPDGERQVHNVKSSDVSHSPGERYDTSRGDVD